MAVPSNGVYIVQGEMSLVVAAMRRGVRWTSHSHLEEDSDPLARNFSDLKEILNHISDLSDLEPNSYLSPFLDVIRSEDTTGPVTGLALSSVNKFLSYGLLEPTNVSASAAVENITDAVTHARFVGTDPGSDEVVLMKILQVLRTLVLTPVGTLLTNESVCEIMQSCFRICFEMRLSELLRKSAEHALMDMVQLLFARLPQFSEDSKWNLNFKKLKMRASGMDTSRNKQRKRSPRPRHKKITNASSHKLDELHLSASSSQLSALSPDSGMGSPQESNTVQLTNSLQRITTSTSCPSLDADVELTGVVVQKPEDGPPQPYQAPSLPQSGSPSFEDNLAVCTPLTTPGEELDVQESFHFASSESVREECKAPSDSSSQSWVDAGQLTQELPNKDLKISKLSEQYGRQLSSSLGDVNDDQESIVSAADIDYINSQGVRFTQQQQARDGTGTGVLIPYGLPCVRELFRFLISLINPVDKHNSDIMIHIGLSLLTVALETGADHINNFNSLLSLVRDDLCRNLFLLISSERMPVFAAMLRVCFLLFESLRSHLKFQLEMYLTKLMDIIASESSRITYEQHEMVLDAVVQLWRIPGLVTELYLNYDCDLYCFNLFEDLTKLLSKNAFPVSGMLYSTHLLSLDALLTVVDSIEMHCHCRILNERQSHEKVQLAERVLSERKDSVDSDKSTSGDATATVSASGFLLAQQLLNKDKSSSCNGSKLHTSLTRANRMKLSDKIPNHEQIMAIKHKKKLLASGTEHFNSKPSKGIQFLQDNNLLSCNLEPLEVVTFLKENPRLDKKMIGEFVSSRKNLKVLETFVKSFNFEDTRVDEALRMYLETFRLPGEAPVISLLLEHFAEHWHKSNGEPFANNDAAFTLAYAIIMLNVDQHNNNVKKQNNPMTLEEFRKNLTKVNGGQDFDQDMLEEVYNAIRSDEIVMPAEHTGLVKENYMWKVLLRRGSSKDGAFIHAPNGIFDHDLFSLTWGPTVAALSFVFDKSPDEIIIQRAISGFRKCAMISAHYGMSDVFDNLVISLCKFTTLLNATEAPECLPVTFGSNAKAQLAAKTVFNLAHRHGDILREGWKNLLDCMLQLFKAKLLPKDLVEAEDFAEPYGHISLIREEVPSQRVDSGLFSSFYSYITLTSESQSQRGPTQEDLEAQQRAQACIQDCHPEQLVTESKFLQMDSLQELVKALIFASHAPDGHISLSGSYDEDTVVFFLELLIKIVLQNRDRVGAIWSGVRDHIYSLVMGASASEHTFLMERAVVGILRLAIRLLRREDMTAQVLQSLRMLLLLKPHTLYCVSRQISFALYELLKTTAANIHTSQDWSTLFTLLECAGAGAKPPKIMNGTTIETPEVTKDTGAQSDSEISSGHVTQDSGVGSDRGYTSDSELSYGSAVKHSPLHVPNSEVSGNSSSSASGGWILVGKAGEIETVQVRPLPVNQYNIIFQRELLTHDTSAFVKACESLAFLVRDVAHITPENFESCVHCIRTFVEASLNGGKNATEKRNGKHRDGKERKAPKGSRRSRDEPQSNKRSTRRSPSSNSAYQADDEDEAEELPGTYHQLSIQLLDLMHTLHTRAASIFSSWMEDEGSQIMTSTDNTLTEGSYQHPEQFQTELSEEVVGGSLWTKCWCPLLQGIARLCCDMRRAVRASAVTYLQRALLVHDLQMLSPLEWEACFNKVLFPLLSKLLESIVPSDPIGMEETRMRGATLLCKVFLQHLTPLLSLPTFTALWLTILDFMDKYMHADKSDLLYEAIPESLKNMLLVMDTAGIFQSAYGNGQLWTITWDRIDAFLPGLRDEVFKSHQPETAKGQTEPSDVLPDVPMDAVTEDCSDGLAVIHNETPDLNTKEDRRLSLDEVAAANAKRPHSPLTTEMHYPTSSSVILQPPLPTTVVSCSVGIPLASLSTPPLTTPVFHAATGALPAASASIPLIINPSLIGERSLPLSPPHPQVLTSSDSKTQVTVPSSSP